MLSSTGTSWRPWSRQVSGCMLTVGPLTTCSPKPLHRKALCPSTPSCSRGKTSLAKDFQLLHAVEHCFCKDKARKTGLVVLRLKGFGQKVLTISLKVKGQFGIFGTPNKLSLNAAFLPIRLLAGPTEGTVAALKPKPDPFDASALCGGALSRVFGLGPSIKRTNGSPKW